MIKLLNKTILIGSIILFFVCLVNFIRIFIETVSEDCSDKLLHTEFVLNHILYMLGYILGMFLLWVIITQVRRELKHDE